MPGTPLVSVVVPAYVPTRAQAELLDEALRSIGAQSVPDHETIVVDDGSPLDIRRRVVAHPRTSLVVRPNGGSAAARNAGIAASRGRYLVFLDADDQLLPEGLEAGLRGFHEHPECRFVVGDREEMTHEGRPLPLPRSPTPVPDTTWLYDLLLGFDWQIVPPSCAMFDRTAVEAVGGFRDPWGADDLDLYLRVARRFSGYCHATPVTAYRREGSGSSRDGERMLRSIRVVYERQWDVVRGDPVGEEACRRGLARLEAIFKDRLVENMSERVRAHDWPHALRSAALLAFESPRRLLLTLRRA